MSMTIRFSLLRGAILPALFAGSCLVSAGDLALASTGDTANKASAPSVASSVVKNYADIQREVVMALMHDDVDNGRTYRNIKIIATNGKVTLSGRVKNE